MNKTISYRVLSKNDEERSIIVRYWNDVATENVLSTSIDVNGDVMLTPNGWPIHTRTDYNITFYETDISINSIIARIKDSAPKKFLQIMENKLTKTAEEIAEEFSNVNSFIGITNSFEYDDNVRYNQASSNPNVSLNTIVNSVLNYIHYNPSLSLSNSNSSVYINNDGSYNN
jgi:hypothetical protein